MSLNTDRIYGAESSLAIKAPCRVATTTSITLSGLQVVDGVTLVEGDRVLDKDNATASARGVYVASADDWQRAPDFDGNRDVVQGTQVRVTQGTQAGVWIVTTANPIVIDTTSITFTLYDSVSGVSSVNGETGAVVLAISAVGESGEYADILNSPTIPTLTSQLTNDSGFAPATVTSVAGKTGVVILDAQTDITNLALVAKTNIYADLSSKPTIPTLTSQLTNDSGFTTASGFAVKDPVDAATTAALPANTYANGASGVGATLTGNANGAIPSQDGVAMTVGKRVLVKDEVTAANRGVYSVTTVGNGGAPYVLTRVTDYDVAAEIVLGSSFFVTGGTVNIGASYVLTAPTGTITVGTSALAYTKASQAPVISVNGQTGAVVIATTGSSIVYNVKDAPYSAVGNGVADDTAAIQDALDDAEAAGGGVVYLPTGVYGVLGDGTASHGAVQIGDNVTIMGDGIGATEIFLLAAQSGDDLSGIIRTPSAVQTRNVSIKSLTINGNLAAVTDRIIGLYTGVSPSKRARVAVAGTTATVTTYTDDGTATTAHGLTNGQTYYLTNDTNGALRGDFLVAVTGATTFTITVASGTAADTVGYTYVYGAAFAGIADEDIVVDQVEIKNCFAYACDPHERTRRMKVSRCIFHDNGADSDGFTGDGLYDSDITECAAYNNGRNGINVVTSSSNNTVSNCIAHNNGQYGIAVQRGSTTIPRCRSNKIIHNRVYQNGKDGIRLQMCTLHLIEGNSVYENQRNGIVNEGSGRSIIKGNHVYDNGQASNNNYYDIYLVAYNFAADGVTYNSISCAIEGNTVDATLAKKVKYNIYQEPDTSAGNRYLHNTIVNQGATGGIKVVDPQSWVLAFGGAYTPKLSIVTRAGDTGVIEAAYNLDPADTVRFNQLSTVGHPTSNTVRVDRVANYTGGTSGWVNSAVYASTLVSAGTTTFEWAITGVVDNYSTSGENVGIYGQGLNRAAGKTWGMVAEARDLSPIGAVPVNVWGLEVDIFSSKTHTLNNLIGVFVVGGERLSGFDIDPATGLPPVIVRGKIYAGLLVDSFGNTNDHATWTNGIVIGDSQVRTAVHGGQKLACDNGIRIWTDGSTGIWDSGTKTAGCFMDGTYSNGAFVMAAGQKFCWELTGAVVSRFDGSKVTCNRGYEVIDVASSGAYFKGSGGSPTYGIDFGSQVFTGGAVLQSSAINIQNDGQVYMKKSAIQSTSATGGSRTLPSNPATFWQVKMPDGTSYKVPLYNL